MSKFKVMGGIFLVAGTAVGGGMLALPLVSGLVGFTGAALGLIAIWVLMVITGLLVLEVNLALPSYHNSFSSMARATIGKKAQWVAWLSCLLLLYSLVGAYIGGVGSLLNEVARSIHLTVSMPMAAISFTVIFGGFVWLGTYIVDLVNRFFLSAKFILLAIVIVSLFPYIDQPLLTPVFKAHPHAILAMVPIFLTSFGYHTVIPSLRNYFGKDDVIIKKSIIYGSLLPLIVYLLWLMVIIGVIPVQGDRSFSYIAYKHNDLSVFFQVFSHVVQQPFVVGCLNAFSNIAVFTSFLGVSLGLFDFLADGFKRSNTLLGRSQTAGLTFIPPLIFALFYPHGFIFALGYAAIFVTVLEVILPAAMAFCLRRRTDLSSSYRVFGGDVLLWCVMLLGVALICMESFFGLR